MNRPHGLLMAGVMLASLVVTPWGEAANGDRFADIARKARAAYNLAQVQWQRGLAELVIHSNPKFTAVASAQRDLQLAYIEVRTARFEYLLEHDPSRIVLTEGLSTFTNFEWSDHDSKALIQADPSYAALEKKVSAVRKKNDEQPDWPEFRKYFRDTLSKSDEYQELFSAFVSRTKQVEALLASYQGP